MTMTSETIKLNLIPGCDLPVLHSSQFDSGRALTFEIYDGEELFTSFDAYDISLHARKVDGTIIGIDTYNVDSENHQVIFFTTEQLTACAGKNICELVFTDPISGTVVGSCNFWLEVEGDPYSGGIDSASDIENLSTQIASIVDSQLNNYYTKEEIDDQIETIVTEQVTPIVSSIVAEQVPPAVHAELSNYYTKSETDAAFYDKSEVDTLLSGKADTSDLPDMDNYYDKSTTDTLLASKANTSTTYTKTEVDNLIAAIPSNDITTEITTPASVMTFNDGGDNIPLKSLVTEILPIQAGSGVPSPQNVRVISGHSTVNVGNYVKNLFDKNQTLSNGFIQSDGSIGSSSSYVYTDYIKVKPNTNYTTSGDVALSNTRNNIACYDKNFAFIERLNTDTAGGWTFTTPNNCNYIRMNLGGAGRDLSTIQLEEGSTATTYEAYKGSNTTIPLGSTIYGGSFECVKGEGQITKAFFNLANYTGTVRKVSSGANTYFRFDDISPYIKRYGNIICDKYEQKSITESTTDIGIGLVNPTGIDYPMLAFRPANADSYDTTTILTFIQNTLNGLEICYDLLTPTSISVSGANIPTISGLNNVYTDCGNIQSLEYFNNKADDIAAMISLMTRS